MCNCACLLCRPNITSGLIAHTLRPPQPHCPTSTPHAKSVTMATARRVELSSIDEKIDVLGMITVESFPTKNTFRAVGAILALVQVSTLVSAHLWTLMNGSTRTTRLTKNIPCNYLSAVSTCARRWRLRSERGVRVISASLRGWHSRI